MGIFDFFRKPDPPKTVVVSRPSSTAKREPVSRPASQRDVVTAKPKKVPLKVTDSAGLEKNLQLKTKLQEMELSFYCPIRHAKIYCHSVLVDKLGDLTKFIVASIYEGHTIEEISDLTRMGNTTVKEELEYLVRGGLINEDQETLTELGKQYGILLKKFDELSEGIDISFNVFADKFEYIEADQCCDTPEKKYILSGRFIPALARNDNYANSLDIAKVHIENDTPFCREIQNSLYATVKIDRDEIGYKHVYVRDFSKGYSAESDACVKIAIPCDRVSYKPRYAWVDKFREVLPQLSGLEEKYEELLSDKAKQLINASKEEDEAEVITKTINTITGNIARYKDDFCGIPDNQQVYVLDRTPVQLELDAEVCKGIYLEEVNREQLYLIRYFPYNRMEV